ncbi:MAG TPA: aspartyl protease family protein [Planctomycetaceae bacterium]|nr:aspartyl protease family protein [Planctomycetaceae bacterium]
MQFPTLIRQNLDRPIIAVTIHGPHGLSLQTDALIDTGSDVTLFSSDVAHRLKIDLTGLPSLPVMTAVGPIATYQPFELTLEIRRPPDVVRWTGHAGFLPRPMSLSILGTKGFFEFFDINYSNRNRRVEIAACVLLPT